MINISRLIVSLFVIGSVPAAFADSARVSTTCKQPTGNEVTRVSDTHGTDSQGRGEAKSPMFQINVYSEPAAGVVFLGLKDPVTCTATINAGFRITGGRVVIDPNNVYTDYNRQSSSRPPVNEILKKVSSSVSPPLTDSIIYTFKVADDSLKGTINAVFIVNYIAASK